MLEKWLFKKCFYIVPLILFFSIFSVNSLATDLSDDSGNRIIIKFNNIDVSQSKKDIIIARLNNANGVSIHEHRGMSGHATVYELHGIVPIQTLKDLAQKFMEDADIEYAEPDFVSKPFAVPNDPYYAGSQWHYQAPATYPGAMNLPSAWDITKGDANMVIAVIDTGFRPHPDLESRRIAGYDFISDTNTANDGGGRDSDATDPGDSCGSGSTWHGTHVAGTIGALTNNNLGVSGVNWNSKIQHVRVLGKCGGSTSDIADAIRWAAGLTVAGVPDNTTPAKIINMSLGGQHSCSTTEQNAIDDAVATGTVVVVAAGNANMDTSLFAPAGCNNVIAVAAVGKFGQRASYSNWGTVVDVAAPGGSDGDLIWSTLNSGTNGPAADNYVGYNGTSMAAPHVTGAVSLMLAVNPTMTPAQVETYLKDSTRPFPTGTVRDCSTSLCGAGLVDAYAAVAAVSGNIFPTVDAGIDQRVNTNTLVSMSGIGSDTDGTIANYQWTQTSGTTVTLINASTANVSFTTPSTSGVLVFNLVVTDDGGGAANDSITVTVNAPPVANAGADFAASPSQVVQLNGSASSDDFSISSYAWIQTSGTSVTLSNANSATPFFTAPTAYGTVMTFQLTVTDGEGASSTDSVSVTVSATPVVSAGNDLYFNPNQLVTLTATASDGDGTIASYQWVQLSGFGVTLTNATTATASFTAPNYGTSYVFQITVTDNSGQTATDTVNVYIVYPPSIGMSYSTGVNPGVQATLDGSTSVANNGATITSYEWIQTAGTAVAMTNANTAILTFTASNNPGEVLSFKFTVTDNLGMSDSFTATVTVNVAPSVTMLVDQYVAVNTTLIIQMTSYSSYGAVTASWTQTSGTVVALSIVGTGAAQITAPASPTTMVFELHVTDSFTGITTTEEIRVMVGGAPFANAGADQNVNPGVTVTLSGAASSDSDGSIASYSWSQLNGTSVTLANANTVTSTFTAPSTPGTLTFQLTTTDNSGYTASDKIVIIVNAPPTSNAGVDQVVSPSDVVSLDGSGSGSAVIGSIASYLWEQVSGLAVVLTNASTATPTFTAPSVGSLVLKLTVTDNNGATSIDTVTIVVTGEIFVNVGADLVVNPGVNVILSGSASGSSGTITGYNWSQTSGTSMTLTNANTTTANFTAPIAAGVLSFQLQATDDVSQSGTDSLIVTVINATPVLAAISNVSVNAGASINVTISATDANGTTPVLELTGLPAGSTFNAGTGEFVWSNSTAGSFTLNARAVDAQNNIIYDEQSFTITVASAGNLQFDVSTLSVNENASAVTLIVNRTSGSAGTVTVDYASTNGTAIAGSDYTSASGTLTFADGVTSQSFTVNPIDDAEIEGNEIFTINLSNATGYASLSGTINTVTIVDNDVAMPGSLSFSASNYSVAENGLSKTITVNRSGGSDGAIAVSYATSDVSATAGSDYTSASGTLNFADGVTSQTFTVSILDDSSYEGDEALTLTLSNPTAGSSLGTSSASLTITEDDAAILGSLTLSATNYSVAENGVSKTITVNRVGGSDGAITVDYATSNVSATAGSDYTAASGTLSFVDGVTSQTFTISILDDSSYEGDESLTITLTNPTSGTALGTSSASLTITEDDTPMVGSLSFSTASYSVVENGSSKTITVNRVGGSDTAIAVSYLTTDISAIAGSDYTAASGTLNFAGGVTSQTFSISILNDTDVESDESLTLTLSNPTGGATLDTSSVTLTIIEDDIAPIETPGTLSFSVSEYSVTETDGSIQVTINRSGGSDGTVSVNFATSDNTATAGVDYTTQNGLLSFADGVTTQTLLLTIADDTIYEGNESFNITLTNATNGAILDVSNARVVILDNEQPPAPLPGTLTLSEPTYTVAENGASVSIAVNRLGGTDGTVSVDYQVMDGTATVDSDYSNTNDTLVFTNGVTTQSFIIDIVDDQDYEGDETVLINLTNVSANSSLDTASATLTITDDETAPITGNQPPGIPVLLSPSNASTGVNPALAIFDWKEVLDPDGDAVTYVMEYCVNANFASCDIVQAASKLESSTLVAGFGGGAGISLALLGLMGSSSRRQRYLQIVAVIALSIIMSACGTNIPIANGDGTVSQRETNLQSNTMYYWKVTATDSKGLSSTSAVWNFTTR